ncbi:MAG: Na(+)-translocating NADH-quinone reductase subunit A [Paludibacteraceae bacterium]|nr:Na(+)-translocating NADH-quinone reductase subunit A [Paludibacteraceae bacterium]
MQQIKLKKGLDIPMDGKAALTIGSVNRPSVYKIVPDHYAGLTPKLMVKEGDSVKAGSPLFHDKQFAKLLVTSPVSGKVVEINRGERRKVMYIGIEADKAIEYQEFPVQGNEADVKGLLLQSGLWAYIKQRPYDCIAMPSKQPKAIFISSFDTAPLAPDYEFVLAGKGSLLQAGINALSKLAPVYVGIKAGAKATEMRALKNCTLYEVAGKHPAGNVGVQINHVAPMAKGETVFTVNIQDLAIIGKFFTKGIVDAERLVALTGDMAYQPQYYRILPGMPASAILTCNAHKELTVRYISGNVLSGKQIDLNDIICYRANQLSVIAEGTERHEFMGWLLPRFNDFNASNTDPAKCFDNGLMRWLFGEKHYNWDARLKGGRRAIIVSGEYDKVFPMDIYPEHLIKAMIAGNIDKMEQLGAYEVAPEDFALCEYVCTSKMPLQEIVRQALDNLKKEIE